MNRKYAFRNESINKYLTLNRRFIWSKHTDTFLTRCKEGLQLNKDGTLSRCLHFIVLWFGIGLTMGVSCMSRYPFQSWIIVIWVNGLRIWLGAPCTTCTKAAKVEAGELPFDLHRYQISAPYQVRYSALPNHHPLVKDTSTAWLLFLL